MSNVETFTYHLVNINLKASSIRRLKELTFTYHLVNIKSRNEFSIIAVNALYIPHS
ncbi:hypothetical protein SEROH_16260 [Clostridioides difficile]